MNTTKTARTRSAGTKLTEEEYARVEAAAMRRGLTVGEWCQEELLQAAGEPAAMGHQVAKGHWLQRMWVTKS